MDLSSLSRSLSALTLGFALSGAGLASAEDAHRVEASFDNFVNSSTTLMAIEFPAQELIDPFNGNIRAAQSMVDMGTGVLRAYAGAQRMATAQTFPTFGGSDLIVRSGASFTELITISGLGVAVPIDIYMKVEGEVFANGAGTGITADIGGASATASLSLIGVSLVSGFSTSSLQIMADANNNPLVLPSVNVIDPTPNGGILHVTASVTNGSQFSLSGGVGVRVDAPPAKFAQAVADFSHTAYLMISLPAGYSWEASQAGFLSAPAYPVPEAGTWSMMLAGLSALGVVTVRRARRVTAVPR